jgi:hypothetical protein
MPVSPACASYLPRAEHFVAPSTIRAPKQKLRDSVLPKIGHAAARGIATADIIDTEISQKNPFTSSGLCRLQPLNAA